MRDLLLKAALGVLLVSCTPDSSEPPNGTANGGTHAGEPAGGESGAGSGGEAGVGGHGGGGGKAGASAARGGAAGQARGGANASGGRAESGGSPDDAGTGNGSVDAGASGSGADAGDGAGGTSGTGMGGSLVGGAGGLGASGFGGGGHNWGGTGAVGTGATGGACETDGATRPCCQGGTQACSSGSWAACVGAIPSGESCNGVDDDCNGEVDELGFFTCGMGACTTTVAACDADGVSACIPLQPTTRVDSCNGVDDDCDGAVDEDCAACIHVATNGNDSAAIASNGTGAFATVQAALDFADTHRNLATRVCVAPGTACGADATFAGPSGGALTMRDGIELLANYESSGWTRCESSTTRLAPTIGLGVLFPGNIASQTVLDGFAIERNPAATTAGVTVDGARGALLSNLTIVGSAEVDSVYGVNVINGGQALIFKSRIDSGAATATGVAVRAVGGQVLIEDACPIAVDPTTGRCAMTGSTCPSSGPAIIGKGIGEAAVLNAQQLHAVLLDSATGSRIERSAICTEPNLIWQVTAASDTIRVDGDATGLTIRASSVLSNAPFTAGPPGGVGSVRKNVIRAADCAGARPWIVDNHSLHAEAALDLWSVIDAIGDCHPIIEANLQISSRVHKGNADLGAIRCESLAGIGSRCTVTRNASIENVHDVSGPGAPLDERFYSRGVDCSANSCARIDGNGIVGCSSNAFSVSSGYPSASGIALGGGPTLVTHNQIVGLIAPAANNAGGVGVTLAEGARVVENAILGLSSHQSGALRRGRLARGVDANGSAGSFWLVSNEIRALPGSFCEAAQCYSGLGQGEWVSSPKGVLFEGTHGVISDNVVSGGDCSDAIAFAESSLGDHPSSFVDNDLVANVLYLDGGTTELTEPSEVDALTDTNASGTESEICVSVAEP